MSGSGGDSGYDYQADVFAFLAAHILAKQRLGWFDDIADIPVAISCETGGPGDDHGVELLEGGSIEIQAKHGLTKSRHFWAAIQRLITGLATQDARRAVLFVDSTASNTIRTEFRNDVIRLADGRQDELKPVTREVLDFLSENQISEWSIFKRFRLLVVDLHDGSTGRAAALGLLRDVVASSEASQTAFELLGKDGHKRASNRGRRDASALAQMLGSHIRLKTNVPGLQLEMPASSQSCIAASVDLSTILSPVVPSEVFAAFGTGDAWVAGTLGSGFTPPPGGTAFDAVETVLSASLLKHSSSAEPTVAPDPTDLPRLPTPFVTRAATFSALARELDQQNVVAVIGYPKCGKTSLLTEFARSWPGCGVWLGVEQRQREASDWWRWVHLRLAAWLGLATAEPRIVIERLAVKANTLDLLVVIDDVHLLPDLDGVRRLAEAAYVSYGRLKVLIAGVDEPAFLDRTRSAGITNWRVPGFNDNECRQMLEQMIGSLSPSQEAVIGPLRKASDGHPGILRLCQSNIRKISTVEDAEAFVTNLAGGLGTSPDAFQAALFRTFHAGLSSNELELCRRLAVAFRSFPRRLGERLWEHDLSIGDFADAWDGCLLHAFDATDGTRHQLPTLYRDRLLESATKAEQKTWHSVAAETLGAPHDKRIDVLDACDSVMHDIVAGNIGAAFDRASGFLFLSRGPHRLPAIQFLLANFERLYLELVTVDLPFPSAVRWHAARTAAYREVKDVSCAAAAAESLFAALSRDVAERDFAADQLGWAILLIHASMSGNVHWARRAANELRIEAIEGVAADAGRWRCISVLMAYLASDENPVDGLQSIVEEYGRGLLGLWDASFGFDFWRTMGWKVHQFLERTADPGTTNIACLVLSDLAKAADVAGEHQVAAMVLAALCRIQIDCSRDFAAAVRTARRIEPLTRSAEARVIAFAFHALGNALRCNAVLEGAESAYAESIDYWPQECHAERAETLLMLSICKARQGNQADAYEGTRKAGLAYASVGTSWARLSAAQCWLESANIAMNGMPPSKALRALVRARDMLQIDHQESPEWVVLAQLSMHLARRYSSPGATRERPLPGFTIGLRREQVMESMDPTAPTLMLAEACAAAGSPFRAMAYFDEVLRLSTSPDAPYGVAMFALEPALAIRDLKRATEFWLGLVQRPQTSELAMDDSRWSEFGRWHLVRLVSLALTLATSREGSCQLERAEAVLMATCRDDKGGNMTAVAIPLIAVLRDAVSGAREVAEVATDGGLDRSFATSIAYRTLDPAREVAQFWIFHYARGKAINLGDFLKWQWRLLWVSLETGRTNFDFLERFLRQLRELWSLLADSCNDRRLSSTMCDVLGSVGSPFEVLCRARAQLAELMADNSSSAAFCAAMGECLAASDEITWLRPMRDAVVMRLAELILSPIAHEMVDVIEADLKRLDDAVSPSAGRRSHERDVWKRDVVLLQALVTTLKTGEPNAETTSALLRLAPHVGKFTLEASAANFYVWLRHTVRPNDSTTAALHLIDDLLVSEHAMKLAASRDLPDYLRRRLVVACLGAKGRSVTRDLAQAHALLKTQEQKHHGIFEHAAIAAERRLKDSAAAVEQNVIAADKALSEMRDCDEFRTDFLAAVIECVAMRKLVAIIMARFGYAEERNKWLRSAATQLAEALGLTCTLEEPCMLARLRTAYELKSVASVLADAQLQQTAADTIVSLRTHARFDVEISDLEASCRQDTAALSVEPQSAGEISPTWALESADKIPDLVDHLMQASGLPEDRRPHVEDDARKVLYAQKIQHEFCRHLEPLQNLKHTLSPKTICASPTKYTCHCTQLGHHTKIEIDDLAVAINAMQQTYCDGCPSRAPGTSRPP